MSLPLWDSSTNDPILRRGTTNEIDNPSNTKYVAEEIAEGDISCDQASCVYGKEPWMARRTAAEEKMRGGEGGYDTESKNKRRWGKESHMTKNVRKNINTKKH